MIYPPNEKNIAIILNGPPGCGKDTVANWLVNSGELHGIKRQFKDALYAVTANYFGVGLDEYIELASNRATKDSARPAGLRGLTPREALIHASEEICKPRYGSDYFGEVEAKSLARYLGFINTNLFVVYPDGGFVDELHPINRIVDELVIIRLHRDDYTFAGDSRSYLYPDVESFPNQLDFQITEGQELEDSKRVLDLINTTVENLK